MTTINDDMSDIGRYPLSPILDTSTVDADELLDGKIHWAHERTFMSWVRTSLSAFSIGILLVKVSSVTGHEQVTGLILVSLGVFFLLGSSFRYYRQFVIIERGNFLPNRLWPFLSTILCLLGCICILAVLQAGQDISNGGGTNLTDILSIGLAKQEI